MGNLVFINYTGGYSSNSIGDPTYCVSKGVSADNMDACVRVKPSTITNYSVTYSGIKNTTLNLFVGNVFKKQLL